MYGPLEESKNFPPCVPSKTLTDDIKHLLFDTNTTDVILVAAKEKDRIDALDTKSILEVKESCDQGVSGDDVIIDSSTTEPPDALDITQHFTTVIPAHRLILSMRSPVFRTMFANGMAEALTNEVRIQDFDAAAVKEFVGFLYTDQCEVDKHAEQLLSMACMYEVPDLKALCENHLSSTLTVDNAVRMQYLSELYSAEHLGVNALRYITDHAKEVVRARLSTGIQLVQVDLSPELSQTLLHALVGVPSTSGVQNNEG